MNLHAKYLNFYRISINPYHIIMPLLESPKAPEVAFQDCKRSPRSLTSSDFGSSLAQKDGLDFI